MLTRTLLLLVLFGGLQCISWAEDNAMAQGLSSSSSGKGQEKARVCPFGERVCRGKYGEACYNPTLNSCHKGILCLTNERLCEKGSSRPKCFSPSKGETCN